MRRGAGANGSTHVNLAILESLFQVVVDGLVRNLADQRKIRDTNFLLLGSLEDRLGCELRLRLPSPGGFGTSGIFFAPCALCYRLRVVEISACRAFAGVSRVVP